MTHIKRMIEAKRQQMYESAQKYGFASEQTIICSKQLDTLLNILREVEKRTNRMS